GDMVAEIGGDHVLLTTIIGLGGDAHAFEPTPEHARALAQARVLAVNGLGFEAWLPRLLASSSFQGLRVAPSPGSEPLLLGDGAEAGDEGHGAHGAHAHADKAKHGDAHAGHHHEGNIDPHAWQSLANGMIYARNIAAGLAKADPAHASDYFARANRYI